MKIEDLLKRDEKEVIDILKEKMGNAISMEEIKLYKHHIGLIIENAIYREQLRKLEDRCNQQ